MRKLISDIAYDHILNKIFNGDFVQGEKIDELALAEECGISRTPIRQALKTLEIDGLVISGKNQAMEFIELNDDWLKCLGESRIAMETIMGRIVTYNISNADIKKLSDIANECSISFKKKKFNEAITLDIEFRLAMAELSKNEILIELNNRQLKNIKLLKMIINTNELLEKSIQFQFDIIAALDKRDMDLNSKITLNYLVDIHKLDQAVLVF